MEHELEILVTEQEIAQRIEVLSEEISKIIESDAVVVGLLQGAFLFMADIMRGLARNGKTPSTDFLWLSSYGDGQSSGRLNVLADLQRSIAGRQVLLVDDVYDTGKTITFAKEYLKSKGASEVITCLMARKPEAQSLQRPDFLGFDLPNRFLVGYGLDDGGRGRGYPDIRAVKP
jgi:hypoxanthine phosphoribosyltransferase